MHASAALRWYNTAMYRILYFLILVGEFFGERLVAFGGGDNMSVQISNPLGSNNLQTVLQKIVPTLIAIAVPVVAIVVLYGAFLMITSAGDEEKISKGRKAIMWAAIGFVIVLLSTSIVPIIRSLFPANPNIPTRYAP